MLSSTPGAEQRRGFMQEPPKDEPLDRPRNRTGARSYTRKADRLTCSEAQLEAILSEGEST